MPNSNFDTNKIWKKSSSKPSTKRTIVLSSKNQPLEQSLISNIRSSDSHQPQNNFVQDIQSKANNFANSFYDKNWFRTINYQIFAIKTKKNINHIVGISFLTLLSLFCCYLAFFDQNFIIREYSIKFVNESYLNQSQVKRLVNHFHKQKLYGFLPNNQYWFLNDVNLTTSAKQLFSEVKEVSVEQKIWPNQAELVIEINPILATLSVKENNEQKYWRVSQNGEVLSEDKAGILESLVVVEKSYYIVEQNQSEPKPTFKPTLQGYSFAKDAVQMQRLQTTQAIWQMLQKNNIKVISTTFPSISDTDVIIKTDKGTKLLFDTDAFTIPSQTRRIEEFFNSNIDKQLVKESESSSRFAYIDFRIPKRIYFCRVTEACVKE